MSQALNVNPTCPLPNQPRDAIQLAHGGGGTLMHRLIDDVFLSTFQNGTRTAPHDAAVLGATASRLAFTTDSFVVHPLFFPGGDIGSLAVHGTVNDLAMSGANPLCLSAAYILEEGLPIETLKRVAQSMHEAAQRIGISIVTGDTKVVERGKGDGLYVNTAGIGVVKDGLDIAPTSIRPGDVILISGDVGRHGIAVMAQREGLEFETTIKSDSASVVAPVLGLLDAGVEIHCLRDLTRGGLASALNEIASAAAMHIRIDEQSIPVRDDVHAACEILGFDTLYVACEGRFIAFIPEQDVNKALEVLRANAVSERPEVIGTVGETGNPIVTMTTRIGASRIVDMLSGEQLPRIC